MTISRAALLRLGKATAITAILGVCMALVPLGMTLVLPFVVLPMAHLLARWGPRYVAPLVVVAGGLVFLLADMGMASLFVLMLLTLGIVLGIAIRRSWSFPIALVSTASAAVVGLVLWGLTMWLGFGITASKLRSAVDSSIDNATSFYSQMGVSKASADAVSSQLRHLFDVMPYLVPGLLVVGALLLAGCAIVLSYAIFPRLRESVEVRLSLTGFRVHWSAAYASIIGLAMIVVSRGLGSWQNVVLFLGVNVLLISQTFFFYQGLAVVHWFGKTRQLSRGSRTALYLAAVVAQAMLQLTGILGLFDTWLDCRRRFVLKTPGAGPVR
ncbi:MAG: YybS family protein [Actinobacteria bacterium]|nr:YybS family protein [Actinomycetota bacterium]